MVGWLIFNNTFIIGWGNMLINAIWQGSLAILLVWSLLRLFPGIHPTVQCWLWRLTCLKALTVFIGVQPLKLYYHLQIGLRQFAWLLMNPQPSRHLDKITASLMNTSPSLTVPSNGTRIGFYFWLTGLTFLSVALFYGEYLRHKSCRHYVPVTDPATIAHYRDLGRRFKFHKLPQLYATGGISAPMLQGIFHPQIIIPVAMLTDFTHDELRLILAHELAHYKRGDLFWNWLPTLTCLTFFFLPYFGRVKKTIAQLQEICSDRMTVQYTDTTPAKFGNILLQVSLRQEVLRTTGSQARASISFAAQSLTLLKNRLRALRWVHPMTRKRMAVTNIFLLILGITAIIPWQVVEAQPLPVNLLINYLSRSRLELSAHAMLPKRKIKTVTAFIDGKPLSATYNAGGIYLGFAKANEDDFPAVGPHQVDIRLKTTDGVVTDRHWIYFHDAMIWSSQNLDLESNKTIIKIGPLFCVVNNRNNRVTFLSSRRKSI